MNPKTLRKMAVEALKGKTEAGDRVYAPLDWPTTSQSYPAILLQTLVDDKTSKGRNAPQFNTVTTLRITGRVEEFDGDDNDG
ncbi:MAG: ATP-binding protein, partial [Enterobacteriaceae bacterium]